MSQITQFLKNNPIEKLTGNTGVAIPIAGNIDVIGLLGIVVTGSAGRLEISSSTSLSQIDTDSGSLVPSSGIINLLGGTNFNTSGSGNTAILNLDDDIAITGQLQANDVEVLTTISAINGNISTINGDINSGANISAAGNIVAGANLNVLADCTVGGSLIVTNNINLVSGDITGNGKITITGDFRTSGGNAYVSSGNLFVSGNIDASTMSITTLSVTNLTTTGSITAGSGLIVLADGITVNSGDLLLSNGSILTSGSIDAGSTLSSALSADIGTSLIVGTTVSIGSTLTVANDIISVSGDLAILAGSITGSGNIISNSGNISTGSGSIDSGTTISADSHITSNNGDLISLNGDIKALNGGLYVNNINVTCDITTAANINCVNLTASGKIIAGTDLEVQNGDLYLNTGNLYTIVGDIWANRDVDAMYGGLYAPNGDCVVGYDIVANSDITSILGDISARNGYIFAKYSIETSHGDFLCHEGDIIASHGLIRAGASLIADDGLQITGTSQFHSLTTGVAQLSSTGTLSSSTGDDGEILIGSTAGGQSWGNITSADSSVDITNGAGTIDLKTNALFWVDQTTTSVTMVENTCYVANNAGLVTCTLPATCAFGKRFKIVGLGVGGWKLAQQAGQQIHDVSGSTTVGVGGSLASASQYQNVEVVCAVANTTFRVIDSRGNVTIV